MEIGIAALGMVQCLCGQFCSNVSIPQQCRYLRKPQTTVDEFENKIELVSAREADLRVKLREENMLHGMNPTAQVDLWLNNVQTMQATLASFKEECQKNKRWFCGCIPNYYHRLKLGNDVTRKMAEVDLLIEQSDFPENSLVNMQQPERGRTVPTSVLVGGRTGEILQRTWSYLVDINTGIIGVYGMGGVGKTSIVKEINNKCLNHDNTRFDSVIWVTASRDSNQEKLQKDIAKEIGLSFDDQCTAMNMTSKLFESLQRRGRFVLIIDDLWEVFSLDNVGIPVPSNANGCKLLITTRSLNVCRGMETAVDIEVEVLSEAEAWDLFKHKVDEGVLSSSSITDLAMSVARECRGLPLALITVGHALRRENDIEHWRAALSELENSIESREGMQNQVFASLKFSYDRLKDDTARACFLYCALYPEDHLIDTQELIKYWVWEGLLRSSGNRTVKKRSGVMILNELKSACMLESLYQDGSPNEYVKMHDLVRDMAILLTRETPTFMVKSGLGLRFPPRENEWSPNLVRVSLMRNDLGCLEYAPRCPNLCTLLLQYNSISKSICPGFFDHMLNLKLLDLSYTGIENLPESLSILENLHTLLMRSCWKLQHVPTLENLKELKVLDLSYSPIHHMPQGMEMLSNLQHLDLSFTNISQFSFDILPNYRFLESLFLVVPWQNGVGPVLADTMEKCSRLEVLEMNFESLENFDQYIRSDHWILLENFRFFVGYTTSSMNTAQNSVVFSAVQIPQRFVPICLPDRVCELEMSGCPDITYLPFSITPASSRSQLKRCRIKYCYEMDSVIIPELAASFSSLELLEIEGLRNLKQLCREIPAPGTLRLLQILHVTSCNDLETLIPFELVPYLQSLMELRIEKCERISEVIGQQNNSSGIFLPSLQILKLTSLPQLKQISSGAMVCDSLSSLEVVQCPSLETLSFLTEMRPQLVCSLKQIKGSQSWWETVKLNHTSVTVDLHHVFKQVAE